MLVENFYKNIVGNICSCFTNIALSYNKALTQDNENDDPRLPFNVLP